MTTKMNLNEKFGLSTEHRRPKLVASLNGQEAKIIKVMGQFPWHHHEHEDELFLVWKGNFRVEFRDHVVSMGPGECVVVPTELSTAPVRMKKRKFSASNRRAH